MTELLADRALPALAGALGGVLIGASFYGGLWLTVRRMTSSKSPRLLLAISFVARTALAVFGLVLIARTGPWALLGASLGFLASRPLVTRIVTREAMGSPASGSGRGARPEDGRSAADREAPTAPQAPEEPGA